MMLENGSLKALKGSLVIFKADKINGFYFLQEEILNDSTNVAVSTISKNTKLWHLIREGYRKLLSKGF